MTHWQAARLALLAPLAVWLPACDTRESLRTPEPGLERMLLQPRGNPYGSSEFFADGRVMQSPPPFTRPRETRVELDTPLTSGRDPSGYVVEVPMPRTRDLLERGRVRFDRVCATCHGVLGDGVSVVAQKMELRAPPSLHEARIAALPAGRVFEVISQGYGLMPSFAAQVPTGDRWAIVAYLDALRLSRAAPITRLPEAMRAELEREAR